MCVTFFEEYEDRRDKRHATAEAGTAGDGRRTQASRTGQCLL